MHSAAPSWAAKQLSSAPVRVNNVTPNLWRSPAFSRIPLLTTVSRAPAFFSKNRLGSLGAASGFSYDVFAQQRLHSGSAYSLSFKGVSLANPDDLGPNNGAATKEINKRLGAYAGASALFALQTGSAPYAGNLSFANWSSHAFRKLSAANFGPKNFFGLAPVFPAAAGALNVGLSQTPEVSSSLGA